MSFSKEQEFVNFDPAPMCETRKFFGHPKRYIHSRDIPVNHLFSPTQNLKEEEEKNASIFKYDDLNQAVWHIRYYLQKANPPSSSTATTSASNPSDKDFDTWFHIMIRLNVYNDFLHFMDRYNYDEAKILPYFTWCRGGGHLERERTFFFDRHHLHAILVAKNRGRGFFKNVWSRITAPMDFLREEHPEEDDHPYEFKYYEPIQSALHLVNLMGHFSQRYTRCNFGKNPKSSTAGPKHYYMGSPLPKYYDICLAYQWEDDFKELVERKYRHFKPNDCQNSCFLEKVDGFWKIQYKHLPNLIQNLKLPFTSIPPGQENVFMKCIGNTYLTLNDEMQKFYNGKVLKLKGEHE